MKRNLLMIIALSVVFLFSVTAYGGPKVDGEEPGGINSGTHAPANGHDKDNNGKGHDGHGNGWGLGHHKRDCGETGDPECPDGECLFTDGSCGPCPS